MVILDKEAPKPHLYWDIQEKIIRDIAELPPHARIDSRIAMMKRYGVTRTTIEKAISGLAGRGYLYSMNGSGTYVADRNMQEDHAGLADSDMNTWGVVIPRITDDFYPEIVKGIEDVANEHDSHIVLCNSDHDPEKQHAYIEKLVKSGVKGVIVVPAITKLPTAATFELLQRHGIPFVFCNRAIEGIEAPRVLSNNFFGCYLATKYLIRLGHERIAYIAAPVYSIAEHRYQGYLGALSEENAEADPDYVHIVNMDDHEEAGYLCANRLFDLETPPDAIVCFSDAMSQGVYRAAAERGLQVGKDVAVMGYGDTRVCEKLPVKLTSVRYQTYRTGTTAAGILVRLIGGEPPGKTHYVILKPEVVVRESCGEGIFQKTVE